MNTILKQSLFWTPRILCLLFAGFISLFALDVFSPGQSFWHTLRALLIHLIPTAILLAVLALSWRREWVGGILFTLLGVAYLVTSGGRFHWSAYALIAGPLFLLGGLFLMNWFKRAELRR